MVFIRVLQSCVCDLHLEFWLSHSTLPLCLQAAASRPGIKRNSSPPPQEPSTVWLTSASPLSTACQGLISLPYSRVISWLTVSHSFITLIHAGSRCIDSSLPVLFVSVLWFSGLFFWLVSYVKNKVDRVFISWFLIPHLFCFCTTLK